MEAALLELKGSVENIVYHNDENQYTVLELNAGSELVTVVGMFPYVSVGEELQVFGRWSSHATYGQQFKAEAFEHSRPATVAAMMKYLSSGAIKGIGKAMAERIVSTFGEQTLEIMEHDPERLSQIKGISRDKAKKISQEINKIYGVRELMHYLGAFGVRPEDAVNVWKRYGQDSISCIQEDPYSLCEDDIGISFQTADLLAQSMEMTVDNMDRVKAGLQFVLRHNLNNGHTCLPKDKLCSAAAKMMGVPLELAEDGVEELCSEHGLEYIEKGERRFLFLPKQFQSESYIAQRIKLMLKYPPKPIWETVEDLELISREKGMKYAENQKRAIRSALEKGILILTGGPGTGKTTTLNAIIRILKENGEKVLLAAPTGRAAKRMSELTGEEAKTIHRMLEVEWNESDQPGFKRNEKNPLECDCMVIDELSMVDSYMFENLLKAMPLSCRMIFVGDNDQLPSVGAGNILGDLKESGLFETVELKEIFRQSQKSLIVTNAHRIVQGEMPELNKRDNDFFFMPQTNRAQASELIVSLCSSRLPKSYGYSSIHDIQVLCPGRKRDLGTIELNKQLREVINPKEEGKKEAKINGIVYRVGDKVMQTRNNYDLVWERPDLTTGMGVFNGDMGVISHIDKPAAIVRVAMDDRVVSYEFESAFQELELAYAVTVHKSQGNEFSAVVIPLLETAPMLCYRNLLYTAITRAKELLILVGSRGIISKMVENNRKTLRYTGLPELLKAVCKDMS